MGAGAPAIEVSFKPAYEAQPLSLPITSSLSIQSWNCVSLMAIPAHACREYPEKLTKLMRKDLVPELTIF